MSFMSPEVVKGFWWECETNFGTEWLPADVASDEDELLDYIEGSELFECEKIEGFGARLSANGYLDCTEWSVYETEEDAWQGLLDNYEDAFTWAWDVGYGFHLYCPSVVCADVVKEHFQSINGNMIEQDNDFLYTVDDSEECCDEVSYEEV